nr:immunoglobulin light chain junction region [Macaca mulatta]
DYYCYSTETSINHNYIF